MAAAQETIDIRTSADSFFEVIRDYEAYPEILSDMESARILKRTGQTVEAQFTLNLIKRVSYTLRLVEEAPRKLSWTLVDGPFKSNHGSWSLEEIESGLTRATYRVEVTVGGFVPKTIVNRLVSKSLPALLAAFKSEAEKRSMA